MRSISTAVMMLMFAGTAFAAGGIDLTKPFLPTDAQAIGIQLFNPSPAKSQVNSAMTGTITLKKGTGGTVNVTGWLVARIVPTADSTYYFNSDSTKTYPLFADLENYITMDSIPKGELITIVLGAATASIQGM